MSVAASIPSNYSRLIARELRLGTRQLPKLLAGTGLNQAQFLQEDLLLTGAQQIHILRNAIRLSPHPDFGLRLGQRLTPLSHGAMGFLAYSSPDLFTSLHAIQTFLPTRMSFAHLQLKEVDKALQCKVEFDLPLDDEVSRCLAETLAQMFSAIAEFIVGRAVDEAQIHFPHAKPPYHENYAEYLAGEIHFDADLLSISVPLSTCREPNASANHENYQVALQQCESMLAQLHTQTQSYENRVKKLMLSHPPGTLSEDEAAAALFMSKRTLARKLKSENSGFRQIRDEILSQQAAEYLSQRGLSVDAIAALLNYHDSANFRRAFKRWFGMPPDQYRQQV